jgi:hypothetical protein
MMLGVFGPCLFALMLSLSRLSMWFDDGFLLLFFGDFTWQLEVGVCLLPVHTYAVNKRRQSVAHIIPLYPVIMNHELKNDRWTREMTADPERKLFYHALQFFNLGKISFSVSIIASHRFNKTTTGGLWGKPRPVNSAFIPCGIKRDEESYL